MAHVFISIFQHNKQIKSSQLHAWPKIAPTSSMTSQKQMIHWKSASMRSHMHWTWSKWIKSKHSNAAAVISPMQELHSVKEKIQLFGGKTTLNRGPHYLIDTALTRESLSKWDLEYVHQIRQHIHHVFHIFEVIE